MLAVTGTITLSLLTGRPTIRQVASAAGVSTQTVSRVINDRPDVSRVTRQRVQDVINQLGYRPSALARSLVHRRTNTLAVVAWGIEYFGPSRTLIGIEQQAADLGYSLLLHLLSRPDNSSHEEIMNNFMAQQVDGIIWAVPEVGENRNWIKSNRLNQFPPMVFLSMAIQPGIAIVSVNNQDGGRLAAQHLIDQERHTLGIITGPQAWWEARERYLGWKSALDEAGHDFSPALAVESDWSAAGGNQAMTQLLMQAPGIDAVFASSDQIALGAMQAAHASGRRIPQDLAIIGFDNIPESAFFGPPLTTVYQHLNGVGQAAVLNLHRMIEAHRNGREPAEAEVTLSQPELIIRDSTMKL